MRVRMHRTTSVPTTGQGGMPRQSVKRMQTLTVGAGYDLPEDVAKQLIKDGMAVSLERGASRRPQQTADDSQES